MTTLLQLTLHLMLLLALPPLLPAVIARTKAAFAGRVGPPLLQGYYDLAKLLRKDAVWSETTTWVFRAGPVVAVATALAAGALVPLAGMPAPLSFTGDVILYAYLFALGRFFTTAAALDTGSAFEGMGAAREVTFATLTEPAMFFGFLALARASGSFRLAGMVEVERYDGWATSGASLCLVAIAWFLCLLCENCRVPFDDPNTHLELTMIHEVMVLDHGGPAFGMVLYGAALKLFVTAALLVRLVIPFGSASPWLHGAAWLAGILFLAVVVGVVESIMARVRLVRIPQLLVTASLLAAFGTVLLLR